MSERFWSYLSCWHSGAWLALTIISAKQGKWWLVCVGISLMLLMGWISYRQATRAARDEWLDSRDSYE